MTLDDFTAVQEIIAKTAKLYARHTHLCSLVLTADTMPDVLLTLAEADRCMKQIVAQMEEMEGLCERSFFQREQTTVVNT